MVGAKRMESNTGMFVTLGEHIGDKMALLD
jgi:hypothetical protein